MNVYNIYHISRINKCIIHGQLIFIFFKTMRKVTISSIIYFPSPKWTAHNLMNNRTSSDINTSYMLFDRKQSIQKLKSVCVKPKTLVNAQQFHSIKYRKMGEMS